MRPKEVGRIGYPHTDLQLVDGSAPGWRYPKLDHPGVKPQWRSVSSPKSVPQWFSCVSAWINL